MEWLKDFWIDKTLRGIVIIFIVICTIAITLCRIYNPTVGQVFLFGMFSMVFIGVIGGLIDMVVNR